jgi:hypothetical protein
MPTEVVPSPQQRSSELETLMIAAWQAVGDPNLPQRAPLWDPRLLWATLALVAIILVGAVVIVWLDRWRKRSAAKPLSANDQLAQFRELYEEGELSLKEFERIRASLAQQLRAEMNVPAEQPAAPPQEGQQTPPADPQPPPA